MPTEHETKIDAAIRSKGFAIIQNGWPDRLCFKKNAGGKLEVFCVEIKLVNDLVKPNQIMNHAILQQFGMPVYIVRQEADLANLQPCLSLVAYRDEAKSHLENSLTEYAQRLENLDNRYLANKQRLLNRMHEECSERVEALDAQFGRLRKSIENALARFTFMLECLGEKTSPDDQLS